MAGLSIRNGQIALRDRDRVFRLEINHLDVQAGQAVALTGASGSGKTLLLELLGLLRAPGAGTQFGWRDGDVRHDLAGLWANGPRSAALARMRGALFGFVPQTGGLMPFLNVAENIALPQRVTGRQDAAWVKARSTGWACRMWRGCCPAPCRLASASARRLPVHWRIARRL